MNDEELAKELQEGVNGAAFQAATEYVAQLAQLAGRSVPPTVRGIAMNAFQGGYIEGLREMAATSSEATNDLLRVISDRFGQEVRAFANAWMEKEMKE